MKVNICGFHSIHLVPDRHPYPNPRYRTESPIYFIQFTWYQTDILTPNLGTGQNHPYISFSSPGTRQTSLPQPSVQDRITHIFHSIHLVPDRHPYPNPRYRTESPIYSVHFIQFPWYQTDILTPTLGTGQNHPYNHPYTGLRCVKVHVCAFHSIHLVPDRHPYPNPQYRTESPI
jgi:hypothetical protein